LVLFTSWWATAPRPLSIIRSVLSADNFWFFSLRGGRLILSLFFLGQIVFGSAHAQTSPKIVNLGEALGSYLAQSSKLGPASKRELFEKILVKSEQAAFEALVFRGEKSAEFLKRELPKAEASFSAAVVLATDFQPIIDATLAQYQKQFPKADYGYTLLLMPSFVFDGKADELKDGTIVVSFGLDRLSRYKREDLKIVVAHEMFHALQMQNIKKATGKSMTLTDVWHEVWIEGLATYASGVITGQKTVSDVLGNKNIEGCQKDLESETPKLLASFDKKTSEVPDQMDRWFGGHQFAYCMGYLAIQKIAEGYTLADLLQWELTPTTREKLREKIAGITPADILGPSPATTLNPRKDCGPVPPGGTMDSDCNRGIAPPPPGYGK
jgi:hypothetical protein